MKKMISLALALLLALLTLTPSLAEDAAAEDPDFAGIWTDENFDRMVLTILPSEVCWSDERMGEEASARKYVIQMVWPSSDSEESVYNILAELDESGTKLTYEGGLFAEFVYDDNGDVNEEETCLVEDNGTGFFSMNEDGNLFWHDSYLTDADNMTLTRNVAEAPSPEELLESYYKKVIGLETDTAGASLKLAQTVQEIFQFCMAHPFWCMDGVEFGTNLAAAQLMLTEEEKAAFDRNRSVVNQEIARLLMEDEEAGSIYADAGIENQVETLRNTMEIRFSAEVFLYAVETLNEEP